MTGYVISFDVGVRNLGVAASAVEQNGYGWTRRTAPRRAPIGASITKI
jgi:DNA-binding transcriptional regulator YdaS (Cro superfamily)